MVVQYEAEVPCFHGDPDVLDDPYSGKFRPLIGPNHEYVGFGLVQWQLINTTPILNLVDNTFYVLLVGGYGHVIGESDCSTSGSICAGMICLMMESFRCSGICSLQCLPSAGRPDVE